MTIILSFNDPYAPHAATVMASIIAHASDKIDFAVLHASLSEEIQTVLTEYFKNQVRSLKFYKIDPSFIAQVSSIQAAPHLLHAEAYLRLFAATVLPDDVVLHIDCDTIVLGDILPIMQEYDIAKPICACNEYDIHYKSVKRPYLKKCHQAYDTYINVESNAYRQQKRLGIQGDFHYFNSGIMIMNLHKWRETNLTTTILEYINTHPFLHAADQDALNAVLNGNFGVLHPKWNSHVLMCGIVTNYSDEELTEATQHPQIVHFTGSVKPWHYMSSHPYKRQYGKYRKNTPWPKRSFPDRNFVNRIRKHIINPLKRISRYMLGPKYMFRIKQMFERY